MSFVERSITTKYLDDIAEPYLGEVYTHRINAPFADWKDLFKRHPLSTFEKVKADPRSIGVPI
jgi:hypothetical protein